METMWIRTLVLCLGVALVSVSGLPRATDAMPGNGQATTSSNGDSAETITNRNSTSGTNSTTTAAGNSTTTQAAVGGQGNSGSTESGEGEDDTLPEGMSESLADFVMDMLKGQFNNATRGSQPSKPAPVSGSNSTTPPDTVTPVNGTAGNVTSAGTESGVESNTTGTEAGGSTDVSTASHSSDDDWSSTESFPDSTSTGSDSTRGKTDCSREVDLADFCKADELVKAYFHDDLTAKGLRSPIFDMQIVERLQNCPRGEWCLGNELDVLSRRMKRFYQGPLCEESMWQCIFDIMVQREDCKDKEFMFVVDAADLMCELFEGEPTQENEKRCWAHTLAALHVTYADFLAQNMTDAKPEMEATCEGQGLRMTKTYLCADSSCDALFDSRIAMEKFGRWAWFMGKVDARVTKCGLVNTNTCGSLRDSGVESSTRTWFGMSTQPDWTQLTTTADTAVHSDLPPEPIDSDYDGMSMNDRLEDEDESLMMALSVATAVGLLFMVLGLIFWRRSKRRHLMYHRGDGYGRLAADEGPLLPKSSD